MLVSTEKTVGELAVENPAAARVFEKHGIDYCCGGKISLEAACKDRGIALEAVLGEMAVSKPKPEERDWKTAPLNELIAHIITRHHAYLKSELPRLAQLCGKVLRAHGEREPRLAEVNEVFEVLKEEL